MKSIMSECGMQSHVSDKTVDSNNVSEAEDSDRFEYNYGWARSRKFLKQLVKDNIDLSLVEYEILRHTKNKRPKTWRQYFLVCLRSNILQILMSLLVLLDAGIVISEIVLEIQSLQTYKSNFRTQLEEFRDIVCTVMYITTPDIGLPFQCYSDEQESQFRKSQVKLNFTYYKKVMNSQISPVEHTNHVKVFTEESNFTNPSPRIENEHHYHLRNHLEKDDELLMDMCSFLSHWYRKYEPSIKCFLNGEIDNIIQRIVTYLQSISDVPNISETKNNTSIHSNDKPRIFQAGKQMDLHNMISLFLSTVNNTDFYNHTNVSELITYSDGVHNEGFCEDSYIRKRQLGARAMHEASEILHYLSIAITALFFLCVLLKLICLGKEFFRDTNEYFDGAIIVASLASDVLYVRYVSETAAAMVVLLLWRIIRIINALMMHKKQQYEFRIAMQKRSRRILGRKMEVIRTEKEMQDKHILALENLLREMGVSSDVVRKCKPLYKKYTKEQTNNALKSIAALTTGFMGGLVGAPSHVQDVISKYGISKYSSTQNFSQSTLQQSESLNVLTKYQRQSVPRLVHIQLPENKRLHGHQMCNNYEKNTGYSFGNHDNISDEIKPTDTVQATDEDNVNFDKLFKRPRAFSLNPQEHWSSLQEKQFQALLLQSESTTKLTKGLQTMKYLNDADIMCEKAEKSSTSIFLRHISDETLNNETISNYNFVNTGKNHHYFLRTLPNIFKKAWNINKHKTNILEEECEINELEESNKLDDNNDKQRKNYLLHGIENFQRANNSYPHSQTTSTVQEILENDELASSPMYNLNESNEFMNSPTDVIFMKDNKINNNNNNLDKNCLISSNTLQSIDQFTATHDTITDTLHKRSIKSIHNTNNNVHNVYNESDTANRKESDEQIWILQPGYIWCQSENQAKLSTKKSKYSLTNSRPKEKSKIMKMKQVFSRGKVLRKLSKTQQSLQSKSTNS
ncbi:unnamed protein product [Schistosoma turkestanicum]|nr:unnamed protein product [Schistosoma turkestanicum]